MNSNLNSNLQQTSNIPQFIPNHQQQQQPIYTNLENNNPNTYQSLSNVQQQQQQQQQPTFSAIHNNFIQSDQTQTSQQPSMPIRSNDRTFSCNGGDCTNNNSNGMNNNGNNFNGNFPNNNNNNNNNLPRDNVNYGNNLLNLNLQIYNVQGLLQYADELDSIAIASCREYNDILLIKESSIEYRVDFNDIPADQNTFNRINAVLPKLRQGRKVIDEWLRDFQYKTEDLRENLREYEETLVTIQNIYDNLTFAANNVNVVQLAKQNVSKSKVIQKRINTLASLNVEINRQLQDINFKLRDLYNGTLRVKKDRTDKRVNIVDLLNSLNVITNEDVTPLNRVQNYIANIINSKPNNFVLKTNPMKRSEYINDIVDSVRKSRNIKTSVNNYNSSNSNSGGIGSNSNSSNSGGGIGNNIQSNNITEDEFRTKMMDLMNNSYYDTTTSKRYDEVFNRVLERFKNSPSYNDILGLINKFRVENTLTNLVDRFNREIDGNRNLFGNSQSIMNIRNNLIGVDKDNYYKDFDELKDKVVQAISKQRDKETSIRANNKGIIGNNVVINDATTAAAVAEDEEIDFNTNNPFSNNFEVPPNSFSKIHNTFTNDRKLGEYYEGDFTEIMMDAEDNNYTSLPSILADEEGNLNDLNVNNYNGGGDDDTIYSASSIGKTRFANEDSSNYSFTSVNNGSEGSVVGNTQFADTTAFIDLSEGSIIGNTAMANTLMGESVTGIEFTQPQPPPPY